MKELRDKLYKYKVLFIDDEPEIRRTMQIFLDKMFHSVVLCSDGQEALEVFKNNSDIDIVFTDIVMPNLDGIELAVKIKEINPKVKLVFFSATRGNHKMPEDLEYEYLTKPVSFDRLINLLKNLEI